jgi:hypothetical protein
MQYQVGIQCFVLRIVLIYVTSYSYFQFMMQDGMAWLLNPPEQNLPLILDDEGFDVWIASTRRHQI